MKNIVLVSMMSVALSGCATFKQHDVPASPQGLAQTELVEANYSFASSQEPIEAWWEAFDDKQLTALIQQALKANLDVRIAYANVLEARAATRAISADRYPSVSTEAGYSRNLYSEEFPSSSVRAADRYEAGFDASWELDLFGRVQASIDATIAQEEALIANLDHMYVTVAAEVARQYVELRGAQYRLDIAQRNADNQAETLKLTENMFQAGSASALDVARAKTQYQLTLATIPPLNAEVAANIYGLSVLTAQLPDSLKSSLSKKQSLPSLPITVAVGNAGDLLKRRPDIRYAERTLAASVSEYNVAVADLFPRVDLLGSIGFLSTNLATFGTSALAGSIGPSLSWQVFDRNRLYAQIDSRNARIDAAVAQYEKTVLSAFQETQTALSDFSNEEARRIELQAAAASAQHAVNLAKQRFDSGYDSFIDVLDAERTLLQAEDSLANSEISAGLDLISIYKALGGGWQVVTAE